MSKSPQADTLNAAMSDSSGTTAPSDPELRPYHVLERGLGEYFPPTHKPEDGEKSGVSFKKSDMNLKGKHEDDYLCLRPSRFAAVCAHKGALADRFGEYDSLPLLHPSATIHKSDKCFRMDYGVLDSIFERQPDVSMSENGPEYVGPSGEKGPPIVFCAPV